MRVSVRRQEYGREYGRRLGEVAGAVIPVAIESPELIPVTTRVGGELGAVAGEAVERKVREVFGDSCTLLDYIVKKARDMNYPRYFELSQIAGDLKRMFNC